MPISQPAVARVAQVWPKWLPIAVSQAIEAPSLAGKPLSSAYFSSPQRQTYPVDSAAASRASNPLSQKLPNSPQQIRNISTSSRRVRQITSQNISSLKPPQQVCDLTSPSSSEQWTPPPDVSKMPVAIIGAGVLGRRLAMIWASTGRPVNVYDVSQSAIDSATIYIADHLTDYCTKYKTHPGRVRFTTDLEDAAANAWMAIEAVPEDPELKISILNNLDQVTLKSCIIATNSISFTSRELSSEVSRRYRLLNTLYYIPPENRCVELMSCGYTSPEIFKFLSQQMKEIRLRPMVAVDDARGMIFPRIWGAIQRETLSMLQKGVAAPEDIDGLFRDFFGAEKGPCEKMDDVGLDTTTAAERHYLAKMENKGFGKGHLKWLEDEYVGKGKLGQKSGEGLVSKTDENGKTIRRESPAQEVWKEHSIDVSGL
ncbi:uncharacterized protein BP5553_02118 [Venustampulla echinocandica]|uniref:NAD(P)-binding protein n=1 Tax=Venustampulla echinocandica TaxID=2656787 RepID=A0A370U2Y8_9HELO|nr:uncharacterized protein BP5553_02118 [Venustampulla echinocandica]RDL42139.1 hypothetical protein BP5553_02118 [Venustampulla echinocandica]